MVLAYPLTGAWEVLMPFCSTPEVTYRTTPTASPAFTAWAVVEDVSITEGDEEIDVRQIGSNDLYGMVTAFHNYGFSMKVHPFAITQLQYGSEKPVGAGTSFESLSFALKYRQAEGTSAMNTYYRLFKGCKMNQLTISVSAKGLVECDTDWIVGEVTVASQAANAGLTTPTFPTFASITSAPISNLDGGNNPFTFNSLPRPVQEFSITWNNNLIPDAFAGSGYLDALTTGQREVTGTFTTPVGNDLVLETAVHDFPQLAVPGKYVFKTGVMVANITGMKVLGSSPAFSSTANETLKHTFNWKAANAVLATS
jgi:Phage tail tube protein